MADLDAVLPPPLGDPQALDTVAARLRLVLGRSEETVLARPGASGLDLAGLWEGPAFEAARAELSSAGAALRDLSGRLLPAAAALDGYAAALADGRRLVAGLQEEWRAADRVVEGVAAGPGLVGEDPTAGLGALQAADASRERTRMELRSRHTRCLHDVAAAEERAAAVVRSAVGEATPERTRDLLLGRLPLTSGAQHQAQATALVDRALAGCDPDPSRWTGEQLRELTTAVSGAAGDPLVARALLLRLGPEGLEQAARLLGPAGTDPAVGSLEWTEAARRTLALAFATTVSDLDAGDPVSTESGRQWQTEWVSTLLGRPLESVTAQLGLVALATVGAAPVIPSAGYAAGALRALLRSDAPPQRRLHWQPSLRGGLLGSVLAPVPDGFALLFSALGSDLARAREVLLAPGDEGPTLVHDLVAHRPFAALGTSGQVTSSEGLGRLLERLATSPAGSSADEPRLRAAVLDALGEAGQRWWPLEGRETATVDRRLDPLRRPAALLLAGEPARVWEAVGPIGVDRDGGSSAARTQALLGEIGKDPAALNVALASLAAFEADRLSQRLAAGNPPTSAPVQAAALRLGYVVGFTAQSAAAALGRAAEQHDAVSADERTLAGDVAQLAGLLPWASAGPVGVVAGAALAPARVLVLAAVADANPVDHGEKAAGAATARLARSRELCTSSALKAAQLRAGDDEAVLTVVSLEAGDSVANGAAAVNPAGPAPSRAP